jgi:hypothetical protein
MVFCWGYLADQSNMKSSQGSKGGNCIATQSHMKTKGNCKLAVRNLFFLIFCGKKSPPQLRSRPIY